MLRRKSEGRLVHRVARTKSEEETFRKLVGECCEGLGYDRRMSPDHVCYRNPYSDPTGPGGYCCKSGERLRRGCGFCPVEQVVVDEDGVEAVFLTELRSLDDLMEGFVGR